MNRHRSRHDRSPQDRSPDDVGDGRGEPLRPLLSLYTALWCLAAIAVAEAAAVACWAAGLTRLGNSLQSLVLIALFFSSIPLGIAVNYGAKTRRHGVLLGGMLGAGCMIGGPLLAWAGHTADGGTSGLPAGAVTFAAAWLFLFGMGVLGGNDKIQSYVD